MEFSYLSLLPYLPDPPLFYTSKSMYSFLNSSFTINAVHFFSCFFLIRKKMLSFFTTTKETAVSDINIEQTPC